VYSSDDWQVEKIEVDVTNFRLHGSFSVSKNFLAVINQPPLAEVEVGLYSLETNESVQILSDIPYYYCNKVEFSPDGLYLICYNKNNRGSKTNTLIAWKRDEDTGRYHKPHLIKINLATEISSHHIYHFFYSNNQLATLLTSYNRKNLALSVNNFPFNRGLKTYTLESSSSIYLYPHWFSLFRSTVYVPYFDFNRIG